MQFYALLIMKPMKKIIKVPKLHICQKNFKSSLSQPSSSFVIYS